MEQIRILFRDYPLTWIVLIAILLGSIVSFLSPNFLTFMNMTNLLKQVSIVAVLAAGQTVVILSGGIDLSVGSILALTAVVIGFNYPDSKWYKLSYNLLSDKKNKTGIISKIKNLL